MSVKVLTHIEKVIIVLSYMYKEDLALFYSIYNKLNLDHTAKNKLLIHVKTPRYYDHQDVRATLNEFYHLLDSEDIVPRRILAKLHDQLIQSPQVSTDSTDQKSIFSKIPVEDWLSFLSTQHNYVKGLFLHSLSTVEIKHFMSAIEVNTISEYLQYYQNL